MTWSVCLMSAYNEIEVKTKNVIFTIIDEKLMSTN